MKELHPLIFSRNWKEFEKILDEKKYSSVFLLCDSHTIKKCTPRLAKTISAYKMKIFTIRAGEQHKNITTLQSIWNFLTKNKADRKSVLITLGGGVISDIGGFAAATYKRGIDCIFIPTTLLAMVDAAIGGKTGIDFENYKNQIGIFKLPAATIINTIFLKTLPPEEMKNGFAEVIKHALLNDDPADWNRIKQLRTFSDISWEKVIRSSSAFKMKIASQDPGEHNIRQILNYGHTYGHALEGFMLGQRQKISHGHAVALGMAAENYLSLKMGLLDEKKCAEINNCIYTYFRKIPVFGRYIEKIFSFLEQDKKNFSLTFNFALLQDQGKPVICPIEDRNLIKIGLKQLIIENESHGTKKRESIGRGNGVTRIKKHK